MESTTTAPTAFEIATNASVNVTALINDTLFDYSDLESSGGKCYDRLLI